MWLLIYSPLHSNKDFQLQTLTLKWDNLFIINFHPAIKTATKTKNQYKLYDHQIFSIFYPVNNTSF